MPPDHALKARLFVRQHGKVLVSCTAPSQLLLDVLLLQLSNRNNSTLSGYKDEMMHKLPTDQTVCTINNEVVIFSLSCF